MVFYPSSGAQPGRRAHPDYLKEMAEWTGLEPATPGVTGRYSNQLNYHSACWWVLRGSNPRPSPCKGDALPAELSTPWKRRGSLREVHRLGNWRAFSASDASKMTRNIKQARLDFVKAVGPHAGDRRIAGQQMVTGHVLRVAKICTDIPFWQHVPPLSTHSGVQRVGRR